MKKPFQRWDVHLTCIIVRVFSKWFWVKNSYLGNIKNPLLFSFFNSLKLNFERSVVLIFNKFLNTNLLFVNTLNTFLEYFRNLNMYWAIILEFISMSQFYNRNILLLVLLHNYILELHTIVYRIWLWYMITERRTTDVRKCVCCY